MALIYTLSLFQEKDTIFTSRGGAGGWIKAMQKSVKLGRNLKLNLFLSLFNQFKLPEMMSKMFGMETNPLFIIQWPVIRM